MRNFITRNPAAIIQNIWSRNIRNFSALIRAEISDESKQKFIDFVEGRYEDPYKNYMAIKEQSSHILQNIIAEETKEVLKNFGRKGHSLILLQNCPIVGHKSLSPTPTSSIQPKEKDYVSEYFMLGLAGLINATPFLIESVRDGSVINQVIPLDPKAISGSGSKKEFNLHNEVVHENHVPDFFVLLCLRGNPFAKTTYCFLEDIIKYLPPQIIEELQKPNFMMKSGDKSIFKEAKQLKCPILTKDENDDFKIRLNTAPGRCEALTPEAEFALNYLNNCLKNQIPIHDVTLSPGNALIVHDRKLLHGRSSFDENYKPDSESDKRWLQRMNLDKAKIHQSR